MERAESCYTNQPVLLFTVDHFLNTALLMNGVSPITQRLSQKGTALEYAMWSGQVCPVMISLVANAHSDGGVMHVRAHRVVLHNRQALATLEGLPVIAVV